MSKFVSTLRVVQSEPCRSRIKLFFADWLMHFAFKIIGAEYVESDVQAFHGDYSNE